MQDEEHCKCNVESEDCNGNADIDYYKVLSLNRDCDLFDIRKAFEEFAVQYNTDNKQDKNLFSQFCIIAEAYEVLSNPNKRIIYDNFGTSGLMKHILEPYGWADTFTYHKDPLKTYRDFLGSNKFCSDLLSLSENVFMLEEHQKSREKLCKRKNIMNKLYLTLEEVFFGGLKKINIKKSVLVDNYSKETIIQDKILKIPIKPGLPTGTNIIFPEEGDEIPYTIPGDIIFTTQDRPHKIFQRDGANLLMKVKVTLQESLLGTVITVNTIDGRIIRVKITSIIAPDYTKTVPGEGLPLVENWRERGDLTISFKIEFPLYLNVSSKNDIKRAFTDASKYTAKSGNEYIHRFILNDKMRKNGEPSSSTTI